MSRGPGRIERAIKGAFDAEPQRVFTTDELCAQVFAGAPRIEKKHRVSLIRAAKRVIAREENWRMARARMPGAPLVFFSNRATNLPPGLPPAAAPERSAERR